MDEMHIPRRHYVPTWTPAERAIQAAVDAVEAMDADIRLTDAVNLLQAAKDAVGDYVDGISRFRRRAVTDLAKA